MPKTIIETIEVIGTAVDGSPLHRWTENNGHTYEEYNTTFTGTSGTVYGITMVRQVD